MSNILGISGIISCYLISFEAYVNGLLKLREISNASSRKSEAIAFIPVASPMSEGDRFRLDLAAI